MSAPAISPHTIAALVLSGLSALGMLYMEFSHNDRVDVQRISVVESRQNDMTQRLDRIETKVDKLLEHWGIDKQ